MAPKQNGAKQGGASRALFSSLLLVVEETLFKYGESIDTVVCWVGDSNSFFLYRGTQSTVDGPFRGLRRKLCVPLELKIFDGVP
eukprot:scaffold13126_cov175-Amphora_coffeaeformis.AAC.2